MSNFWSDGILWRLWPVSVMDYLFIGIVVVSFVLAIRYVYKTM